jgi:hypothetical protein
MKHHASSAFWTFALLKKDAQHPSLHFKKFGSYWSVRVGLRYRALAMEVDDGLLWFWIGSHSDYEQMIRRRAPPRRPEKTGPDMQIAAPGRQDLDSAAH